MGDFMADVERGPMTLFHRHPRNPILRAADWPYPVHTVFNPGVTRLPDGSTLLLCRVEDRRGLSHLCAARSRNGIDGWQIDAAPTLRPDPVGHAEELFGIEDARITYVPELRAYYVAYTAYSADGPGVSLARTADFVTFERLGMVMPPENKDAAVLSRRVGNQWALIHRPMGYGRADIWISFSPDMQSWGGHQRLLAARHGSWWDATKIGLSCPLIETPAGWLMLYHGVRPTASGALYRLGLALFELDHPERCLLRGDEWVFAPETDYERDGDVNNVVFPCGYTLSDDGDTLSLYYGAADTCIALATASIRVLLDWLRRYGRPVDASRQE